MSRWIVTNFDELNTNLPQEQPKEVRVNVFLSPFQTPLAVRGEKRNDGFFIIHFAYHSAENDFESVASEDKVVTLKVGKDSKRIFQILIDLKKCNAEKIGLHFSHSEKLNLAETLKEQTLKHLKKNEQGTNAVIAERLLNAKSVDSIFQQLALG